MYAQTKVDEETGLMSEEAHMKSVRTKTLELLRNESGGEVIEYALILGLIAVAAIAVIGAVGVRVLARWSSINSTM